MNGRTENLSISVSNPLKKPAFCRLADGWPAVLEPVVARYQGIVKRLYFRSDAAFASPEIYEFLEAEDAGHTIRLAVNPPS